MISTEKAGKLRVEFQATAGKSGIHVPELCASIGVTRKIYPHFLRRVLKMK